MTIRLLVALLILTAPAAGCAIATLEPSATLTTLMPDAERWFRVTWEVAPRGEQRVLSGYVENLYGEPAARVQLLAQALDANGAVVGQRIEWVPGVIGGFGRVYYEIPRLPAAAHYRVTVWAYERLQAPGGGLVFH